VTTTASVAPRSLAATRIAASSSTPTRGHSPRSSTAKSTTRQAGPRWYTGGAGSSVPNAYPNDGSETSAIAPPSSIRPSRYPRCAPAAPGAGRQNRGWKVA